MNTTLTTVDNTEIIIPNSVMTSVVVENVSANDTRRLALSYTISYETDTDKARMILTKVVKSEKNILSDPAPAVVVGEYKDSAVELTARVWCKSSETVSLRDQMQEDVKKAFDAEGINIPFPQVDVHVIAPKEEKNN
jgi:small conductance mechanosensitive channel